MRVRGTLTDEVSRPARGTRRDCALAVAARGKVRLGDSLPGADLTVPCGLFCPRVKRANVLSGRPFVIGGCSQASRGRDSSGVFERRK
jgi:hypothetical protein